MAKRLFTKEDRKRIVAAIQNAERQTSGEIQVHLEAHCRGDVLDQAASVFETLKMHQTKRRNGVLFYLAVEDHKLAILGDVGINQVVPKDFWENIKATMIAHFKTENYTQGLVEGISMAGEQLSHHFPKGESDHINELPDEISFG